MLRIGGLDGVIDEQQEHTQHIEKSFLLCVCVLISSQLTFIWMYLRTAVVVDVVVVVFIATRLFIFTPSSLPPLIYFLACFLRTVLYRAACQHTQRTHIDTLMLIICCVYFIINY